MPVSHQVQKPLCLLMASVCHHAVASSYQAQPGRRAAVSNRIPDTYSEAHFLPMLPHATRRDDVAGNKQVYGGVRTYKRYVGSASGSASLLRVHGHPDKLHCLTYPDEVA